MAPTARDLALDRARRYLLRCGAVPDAELEAELERVVEEPALQDDARQALDRVMDYVQQRLAPAAVEVPPGAPPIHRASMGYG